MMGYGYGMGAGGWVGWIAMAVFWIGLIALVVWGVSRAFPSGKDRGETSWAPRSESPAEVLDRRYAAGEIDEDRYQAMRATLASSATVRS